MHVRIWLSKNWHFFALALLLPAALALRLYGMDWDRGLLFHPDERQILMVVARLAWPDSLRAALSPDSPLNPHFFAYGSFPLYLLRLLSALVAAVRGTTWSLYAMAPVGRVLSALFDTFTVFAAYRLARRAFGRTAAVLAAMLLTFAVLHIQLAHFYAVDTLLTVFIVLAATQAVDLARSSSPRDGRWLGVWYGLALATKASALPFGIVILLAWLSAGWARTPAGNMRKRLVGTCRSVWRGLAGTFGIALLCFVFLEPYALIDAVTFVRGIGQEIAMSQGWYDLPYTRQYAGTTRYLYPVRQMVLFTAGPLFTALGLAGLAYWSGRAVLGLRRGTVLPHEAVWLVWPVLYGVAQGGGYVKFVRYMLPLFPFLAIAGAALWLAGWRWCARWQGTWRRAVRGLWAALLVLTLTSTAFYAFAFLNVYSEVHPWLQANEWLCQHIPSGATLLIEHWDDPVPVYRSATEGCPVQYEFYRMDSYAPDGPEKLAVLLDGLEQCEYIVLSSDRLYATISRLPERYPLSSRYFALLFSGELGYELAYAPAVYPRWGGVLLQDTPRARLPLPELSLTAPQAPLVLRLGRADESFTVYDHPQPLVFRCVRAIPRHELARLLQP